MEENFDNKVSVEEEEDIIINENTTKLFIRLLEDDRFIKYKDLINDLIKKNFKRESCTNNDDDIKEIIENKNDFKKIKLDVINKKQNIKKQKYNYLKNN